MKELIEKAKKDKEAMYEVVEAFMPLIKKVVRLYEKDYENFEDEIQEGRLILIKCIRGYDISSNCPFEAYVKKAVYHSLRCYIIKKNSNLDWSLDNEIEEGITLIDLLDSGVDIEGDIVAKENIKKLRWAIDKLKPKYKDLVIDIYFNKVSMASICKERNCHYMTVVSTKERALKKLYEFMKV